MSAELSKPVADYPEFWLGQIKVVAEMEQSGRLTKTQMVNEVRSILKNMASHGREQTLRAEKFLRKESHEQPT